MLTTPNSLYKTGMAVGIVWAVGCALLSLYTMFLLSSLYLERKRAMVGGQPALGMRQHKPTSTAWHVPVGLSERIDIGWCRTASALAMVAASRMIRPAPAAGEQPTTTATLPAILSAQPGSTSSKLIVQQVFMVSAASLSWLTDLRSQTWQHCRT